MKNATDHRSRRLLPLLILAGLASPASTLSAGVGVWTSGGPYGGKIRALAIDPANPATLYAGGSSYGGVDGPSGGGVFKSSNGGASWTAINMGLASTNVHALAIDPANRATLYAGTTSGFFSPSGGVFKSTDAGGAWFAANTGLTGESVEALAINPLTPATLYAAGSDGVFKSTDSGGTWAAANTGLTNPYVQVLAINPITPATLYAAGSGGVFKSTDAGGTWIAANTGLTDLDVDTLAIDPATPSTVYAGTFDGGIFKSTDSGGTWAKANTGLKDLFVRALAIDPATPSTLYAGMGLGVFKSTDSGGNWSAAGLASEAVLTLAINASIPSTLLAGTFRGGVFKSPDAGGIWAAANTGLLNLGVIALVINPSTPSTLYAGTGTGGLFKSTDSGGTWVAANTGLDDPVVTALAIDPADPSTLYAGSFNGGVFKSTDSGGTWSLTGLERSFDYCDVSALAIDPAKPSTVYAGMPCAGVFKTTTSGGGWGTVNAGLTDPSVRVLAIDPTNPTTLYAGAYGIFKSTNSGDTWTAAGLASPDVQALAINPSNSATVYAGTSSGGVFKSTDSGATWAAANAGLTSLSVNALAIDPTTPSTLYAGTGGGVFRSTDSGGTWAAFNTGLPNLPVDALAFDPTGATTLYAGLEGGGVWQLTAPTTGTITALLPASAHSSGVNGAFYTTNVAVANTGSLAASFTLKFLGHDQDGSNGPERSFSLDPGESRTFVDVLGSVFNQTSNFGAVRVTSNTSALDIASVTSTPGFGGTFGQAIPAVAFADLIPAGSSRSILYIREGDGFRSNLILASGSFVSTDVDVALVLPTGDWDYARIGQTLATKTYTVPPNGMIQINRIARDMGVSGVITGARLVVSSSTAGALFTGFASVIDETTNDPTAVFPQPASVSGSAPYVWLLPASAHSSGLNGAFYTTNVAVANVGAAPASYTMKFLGNNGSAGAWDYARQGTEQTFSLESGKSVIYFDVLGSVFHETSAFGAIRITSDTSSLNIASVTSTPGFGGTLSQTIPAVFSSDLIPAGSSRSILYIREGDGFRSNLILASNADVSTTVDAVLVSAEGALLAGKSYSVPPNGMTQINRLVRDMGVSGPITGARLVLSSSTPDAAFTAFASVIDEVTNDPTAVEAK